MTLNLLNSRFVNENPQLMKSMNIKMCSSAVIFEGQN